MKMSAIEPKLPSAGRLPALILLLLPALFAAAPAAPLAAQPVAIDPPASAPAPAAEPLPAAAPQPPAARVPLAEAAAEPAEPISAAPLQFVPEPYLPESTGEQQQLEAYRAALRGEHGTALELYEKALASEPDNLRWGAEYRQVAIAAAKYDRALAFFERLAKAHPAAANLHLNYAYAFVDKLPAEGALGQMGLAGSAVREFGRAIELEPSWLAFYSRGSSYLYWPPLFGRAALAVADLERAIELAADEPPRSYHAKAWAALGDGFWRLGQRDAMRAAWREGLDRFPGSAELQARLEKQNDADLDGYLVGVYRLGQRIDTRLEEIWQAMREEGP